MKPTVYLETTIPSYLTARPSRDLVIAAHQQLTADWWNNRRDRFRLHISERVLREARSGDADAAARRLAELQGIPLLKITDEVTELLRQFLAKGIIPRKAAEDAFHIAIATVNRMNYLLTWNCRHIVNAEIMKGLAKAAAVMGYTLPVLCTPEQLMGD